VAKKQLNDITPIGKSTLSKVSTQSVIPRLAIAALRKDYSITVGR
jgi:hypothetical protein